MRCVALRIAACPPAHCDVTKAPETSPPAVWPQVIRAKRLRAATRPSGSASEDFRASPRGGYRHLLLT